MKKELPPIAKDADLIDSDGDGWPDGTRPIYEDESDGD